ncbi:MAG: hypothetical protein U0T84_03190 [Chitinophagales bacterium]
MPTLLYLCCLLLMLPPNRNYRQLDGTWSPLREEIGGTSLPAAAFEKQLLQIEDNRYTVLAESVDKGTVVYGKGKMDIDGMEGVNKGKHFKAIYKKKKHQLEICYDLSGKTYPTGFDTKNHPMWFHAVFEQVRIEELK